MAPEYVDVADLGPGLGGHGRRVVLARPAPRVADIGEEGVEVLGPEARAGEVVGLCQDLGQERVVPAGEV